jgi:hypothetical protein
MKLAPKFGGKKLYFVNRAYTFTWYLDLQFRKHEIVLGYKLQLQFAVDFYAKKKPEFKKNS